MLFNLLKIRVYPLNCIQSCYGAAGVLDLEMIEMMMAMMMMSSRLKKKNKNANIASHWVVCPPKLLLVYSRTYVHRFKGRGARAEYECTNLKCALGLQ